MPRFRLKYGSYTAPNKKVYKKGDVRFMLSIDELPALFRNRWEELPEPKMAVEQKKEVEEKTEPKSIRLKRVAKKAEAPVKKPTSKRKTTVAVKEKTEEETAPPQEDDAE